ncbi:nSTAND1 domain-containing NTPase [Amycolatopsis samaneae]|uniref:Novel STAND NTPase 1 domain-containing protein n=1 Tax=Amycolatopsis samaneae TaxID=664691 RepID=A0ABW5GCX3_9PSEU
MPRPERVLEEGDHPVVRFAADLRRLREKAGNPPYRLLATRAFYSAGTLSEAAGGRKLPSLAVALAYAEACGGDRAEWEQRWHEAASALAARVRPERAEPREDAKTCTPYVGLAAFQPEDAERFHGREALVRDLVGGVAKHRLLVVSGASGAGKSSLLRAGLVAGARASGEPVLLMTPGRHPLQECAIALAVASGESAVALCAELRDDEGALRLRARQLVAGRGGDLLVVVDQFEEVFTRCQDPGERARFVEALISATRSEESRVRVVLGIRIDFRDRCSTYPELERAWRDARLSVGPMTADELRRAITRPVVDVGCQVESALLAALVAEHAGGAGALPLLSHALVETWRRRRGNTLTLAGYQAAGGIQDALAHTAEATYEAFTERQQRIAKHLFLRLTTLGADTEDARRGASRDEIPRDHPDVDVVLDTLIGARLIQVDDDSVQMTHDVLIRCWPRLRGWLSEDRDGLRLHRQLTEAVEAWEFLDRDPSALYHGSRLESARIWAAAHDLALNDREREFLDAGAAAETVKRSGAARRRRRVRLLAGLSAVLLVATGAAVVQILRSPAAEEGPQPVMRRSSGSSSCGDRADAVLVQTDRGRHCYPDGGRAEVDLVQYVCAGTVAATVVWSSATTEERTSVVEPGTCAGFEDVPGDTWVHRIERH